MYFGKKKVVLQLAIYLITFLFIYMYSRGSLIDKVGRELRTLETSSGEKQCSIIETM